MNAFGNKEQKDLVEDYAIQNLIKMDESYSIEPFNSLEEYIDSDYHSYLNFKSNGVPFKKEKK